MRLCDLCGHLELNGSVWAVKCFFRADFAWETEHGSFPSTLGLTRSISVAWWWYRCVCRKMDEMSVAVLYSPSLGLRFGACVGRVNGNDVWKPGSGGRSESDVGVGMNHRRGASVS
jgi:hypothetical protein